MVLVKEMQVNEPVRQKDRRNKEERKPDEQRREGIGKRKVERNCWEVKAADPSHQAPVHHGHVVVTTTTTTTTVTTTTTTTTTTTATTTTTPII